MANTAVWGSHGACSETLQGCCVPLSPGANTGFIPALALAGPTNGIPTNTGRNSLAAMVEKCGQRMRDRKMRSGDRDFRWIARHVVGRDADLSGRTAANRVEQFGGRKTPCW